MTFFKRLLKNIFRAAIKDHDGKFLRWQTTHDLVSRILRHAELRELWPSCDGLVVDEGLQIAGDDYDTMFELQDRLSVALRADCHFPLFVLGSEKQTLPVDDGFHGVVERPLLVDARCWGRTFGMRVYRPTTQVRFKSDPAWGETVQAATDGTYNDAMSVPGGPAQLSTAIIMRPLEEFLADHAGVAVTYVLSTHRDVAKRLYERTEELGVGDVRRHRAVLFGGSTEKYVHAHRKAAEGGSQLVSRTLTAILASAAPVHGELCEEGENCAVCWREFVGARLPLDVVWVPGMFLQPREDLLSHTADGSRTLLVRRSDIGVVVGEYDGHDAHGGPLRLPIVRLVDGTEVNVEVMRTKAYLYSHYEVAQLAWANDAEARTKGSCQGGTIQVGVTVVDKKANFQKHSASMTWGRFPTARGLCVLGEIDKAAFDVDVHVRRWCTLMSTARTTATIGRLMRYVLRDVGDR